jgi:uncharacterized protein HemX
MKAVCIALMIGATVVAFPQQKEGSFFTNEAIRQAQNTQLIPPGATIQKVQEGIEVAAIEHLSDNQPINLYQLLKGHVPDEVVSNLQSQVDQVGHST